MHLKANLSSCGDLRAFLLSQIFFCTYPVCSSSRVPLPPSGLPSHLHLLPPTNARQTGRAKQPAGYCSAMWVLHLLDTLVCVFECIVSFQQSNCCCIEDSEIEKELNLQCGMLVSSLWRIPLRRAHDTIGTPNRRQRTSNYWGWLLCHFEKIAIEFSAKTKACVQRK